MNSGPRSDSYSHRPNLCAQPARGLGKSMVVIDLNQAIKRQARAARRAAPCARGRTRDSERTTDLQNRWSTCQRACDLLSNDRMGWF